MCNRLFLLSLVAFLAAVHGQRLSAGEPVVLKIATFAPEGSVWGKSLAAWRKQLEEKTGKALSLEIHYNSTQGSESAIVGKVLSGQLDGAAVTSIGLEQIDKNFGILQLPGVIQSWKTLDVVRKNAGPALEKLLEAKNVKLVAWADVGSVRLLSKGFSIGGPNDLKGQKPWVQVGDAVAEKLFAEIGGVASTPSECATVAPDIDKGKINCLLAPTPNAEVFQWTAKFDNGLDLVSGVAVGAIVISAGAFEKLTAEQQQAFRATGAEMFVGLQKQVRGDDALVWGRFKSRGDTLVHRPNAIELAAWMALFKTVRDKLKGAFDADVVKQFEEALGTKL